MYRPVQKTCANAERSPTAEKDIAGTASIKPYIDSKIQSKGFNNKRAGLLPEFSQRADLLLFDYSTMYKKEFAQLSHGEWILIEVY